MYKAKNVQYEKKTLNKQTEQSNLNIRTSKYNASKVCLSY